MSSLQLLISFNEKIKSTNKYETFTKWAIQSQELLDFKNNLYDSNNLMAKKTIQEYQYKIDVLELTLQQSTELLNELQFCSQNVVTNKNTTPESLINKGFRGLYLYFTSK